MELNLQFSYPIFLVSVMDFKSEKEFLFSKKICILCLTAYYLPGNKSGGPVRSISSLVYHLKNYVKFDIFTSDRDIKDLKQYDGITPNIWSKIDGNRIYYSSNNLYSYLDIIKFLDVDSYDIIYLNSFFGFKYGIFPILVNKLRNRKTVKIILAPRGEFSDGAFNLQKYKKSFFVFLSKLFRLYNDVFWHASSNFEADDINKIMANSIDPNRILVAPDLTNFKYDNLNSNIESIIQINPFKICFISFP